MKVRMLVSTAYKKPLVKGDEVDVPKDFAERWVKNGIAEIIGEAEPETEESKEVDLKSMSAKDLYALCVEKGIEVEQKQPKAYYIEKLA